MGYLESGAEALRRALQEVYPEYTIVVTRRDADAEPDSTTRPTETDADGGGTE